MRSDKSTVRLTKLMKIVDLNIITYRNPIKTDFTQIQATWIGSRGLEMRFEAMTVNSCGFSQTGKLKSFWYHYEGGNYNDTFYKLLVIVPGWFCTCTNSTHAKYFVLSFYTVCITNILEARISFRRLTFYNTRRILY